MRDPYSPNKAFLHCDRLGQYQNGGVPFPVQVHFVISDLCNQNCSFCAYRVDGITEIFRTIEADGSVNKNPNRLMTTANARRTLQELSMAGAKAIQFTGGGEPTMHKDCADLMLYANDLGMDTALVTNGTNLSDELLNSILRCTWVRISLDHSQADGYSKMRSTPHDMFDKVLKNITTIVKAKKESDSIVTIGIGFVVNKDNWSLIYEAALLARHLGVDNFRISAAFTDEGIGYFKEFHDVAYTLSVRAESLSGNGFLVFNKYGERISDLELKAPINKKCPYQYLCTYIGADMNVYRCCVLAYTTRGLIGSLYDSSFSKLWRNNKRTKDLKTFDARKCARCQFNEKNDAINSHIDGSDAEHGNFV